jgi:hypothetical protein
MTLLTLVFWVAITLLFKAGGLCGFLALIRITQYLCNPSSWATNILQPINFGVMKKRPGAIPGVWSGASGNSTKVTFYNEIMKRPQKT